MNKLERITRAVDAIQRADGMPRRGGVSVQVSFWQGSFGLSLGLHGVETFGAPTLDQCCDAAIAALRAMVNDGQRAAMDRMRATLRGGDDVLRLLEAPPQP